MKLKQLSLFLENKPGALSRPIGLLSKNEFNILTLSLADTQNFGILRLIVRDWEKAKKLLEKEGFVVKVTDVVAVAVPDRPGGLSGILAPLEKAGINVEYMYAFTLRSEGKGVLVIRFDDPDSAVEVLKKKGIDVLGMVELYEKFEK